MEQDKMKESQEAMKESLKLASEISYDYDKSAVYSEIFKVLMEQGKMKESLKVAENIKKGSYRIEAFNHFGKTLPFEEAKNMLKTIYSEDNQSAIIKGISENIYEQMKASKTIQPFLYNYSKYTQNLSNILFHQA